MIKSRYFKWLRLLPLFLIIGIAICGGCKDKSASDSTQSNATLDGTWVMESRIVDNVPAPAKEKIIKLQFEPGGKFQGFFKGDESMSWIRAGRGAFSYKPPYLTLYWESGQTSILMVQDKGHDRILVHHGRNMAPLTDQEPDEILVKQAAAK